MFFRCLTAAIGPTFSNAGGLFAMSIRTNIRNKFPVARENKRIKVHGNETRIKTPSGRKILMRRMLKGRFYSSIITNSISFCA
uniref:CSON000467 protein n=1 Tax=Culicoides sonorensis TaxID=179676 RepID=A0A336LT30_CULSO